MRKDYVEPDDYEWEPTPHGGVLEKAAKHYPAPATPPAEATGAAPPPEAKQP
jgi:NADH-quinone oxidoreductase subunit C